MDANLISIYFILTVVASATAGEVSGAIPGSDKVLLGFLCFLEICHKWYGVCNCVRYMAFAITWDFNQNESASGALIGRFIRTGQSEGGTRSRLDYFKRKLDNEKILDT
uniref:SFRICE_007074 n=1 Tax=Spodoptera frugiperda TaxID=7108 RepID=A0A2H1WAP2_SPOFR